MATPFFGIREEVNHPQQQPPPLQPPQSASSAPSSSAAPPKKKRNLPGTPNPDAEVIALSPKTLMATNRFICEVCNKGFQREQNLQLHRRGHNLPWKLKQKNPKEVRRRVYLCPEPTCVHHEPSRALGDLTGIKKHYCRKHGEKKWKCDKCSKRYAVQSDWKAHSKTCGTREYRCDCGTLFSRRDSFITHRAFCDALAQESARIPTGMSTIGSHLYGPAGNMSLGLSHVNQQMSSLQDQTHPSTELLRLGGTGGGSQFDQLMSSANPSVFRGQQPTHSSSFYDDPQSQQSLLQSKPFHGLMQLPELQPNPNSSSTSATAAAANLFNLSFFSNSSSTSTMNNNNNNNSNSNNNNNNHPNPGSHQNAHLLIPDQFNSGNGSNTESPTTLFSGNLMSDHIGGGMNSLYNTSVPQMSATALLQKAAQMGATSGGSGGGSSLLRGFGSTYSSSSTAKPTGFRTNSFGGAGEGSRTQVESENNFEDLMNSLANGNSNMFGGNAGGGVAPFGGFNQGLGGMDDGKLHQSLSIGDRLTRDFLGVGSMVRGMGGGGGISQREQHHGLDMSSLDSEMKSGTSSRSFGSGNLQ
ncbi:protein indeterminate-domain 4, chloroplastic-like [Typha angustifolia]|uniref:protein indeterminate-domain 4, chloroplastic-like n=1 Tax=Typha angustifolia TaxID=59011 RepID=UPI003C2B3F90